MSIAVREYAPSPALRPYVETFWEGHFNTSSLDLLRQQVVPNGYLELIIHTTDDHCRLLQQTTFAPSPDYILIGLFDRAYEIRFQELVHAFGIRFKPEGFHHLFRIPAAEAYQSFADMEDLSGRHFRSFCHQLREEKTTDRRIARSEHFLLERLQKIQPDLYYLNRAAELIRHYDGQISVEELAKKVFISKRQLEREFKQKLGLTPKSYMKLARLNKANRLLAKGEAKELTALSYEAGYADQAHFIRDFKKFTGEKPTVFLRERGQFIVNA